MRGVLEYCSSLLAICVCALICCSLALFSEVSCDFPYPIHPYFLFPGIAELLFCQLVELHVCPLRGVSVIGLFVGVIN